MFRIAFGLGAAKGKHSSPAQAASATSEQGGWNNPQAYIWEAAAQQSFTRLRWWGTCASNVLRHEICSTWWSALLLLCSLASQHGTEQ